VLLMGYLLAGFFRNYANLFIDSDNLKIQFVISACNVKDLCYR
jgi:hypothetical protein